MKPPACVPSVALRSRPVAPHWPRLIGLGGALLLLFALAACSEDDGHPALDEGTELPADDLGLGVLEPGDTKADGAWGAATTCKAIPELEPLVAPRITLSIDGLTLHLVDEVTGYDRVFPIGAGAIDAVASSLTFGESLTMFPLLYTKKQDFVIRPSTITPCKIWWRDSSTGERLPVFAGLPFLSWYGSYGIHGPIDNYRATNGGNLRRGYVSHGCLRMESADILEVYARIRGVAAVPVHVQREAERTADGRRVDVPAVWLGAECAVDADCNYSGGVCQLNRYGGRGFCTQACTRYCPDRPGYPVSFCVANPDAPATGRCVLKETSVNQGCRPYDHLVPTAANRFNSTAQAMVCLPGSPGWIGDHCFGDDDCLEGNTCAVDGGASPGLCTQACTRYCPDQAGWPTTFCVNDPAVGGAACARRCSSASNASECPGETACVERPRNGSTLVREVCL